MPDQMVQARRATRLSSSVSVRESVRRRAGYDPGVVDSFHSVALHLGARHAAYRLLRRIELAEGPSAGDPHPTMICSSSSRRARPTLGDREVGVDRPDAVSVSSAGRRGTRLEAIVPRIAEGWRIMLRGSVAMSRAIPEMATQAAEAEEEGDAAAAALPPLAMAEDEDPGEAAAERAEEPAEMGGEPGAVTLE